MSDQNAGNGRELPHEGTAAAPPRVAGPAAGAEITALTPRPQDPTTWSVSVGRRVVARLDVDDVEAIGLAVGQPWTGERANAVRDALRRAAARRDAMSLLGRRDRSTTELYERLTARGHDAALARQVVETLVGKGLLDDEALARRIAAAALSRKPFAADAIVARLRSRGLDESLARSVAADRAAGGDSVETLVEFGRRRLRAIPGAAPAVACRRIGSALGRLGHDHDTVALVLDRLSLTGRDPDGEDSSESERES